MAEAEAPGRVEATARAEREARAARQISDFLEELFVVSDPSEARGNSVTAPDTGGNQRELRARCFQHCIREGLCARG